MASMACMAATQSTLSGSGARLLGEQQWQAAGHGCSGVEAPRTRWNRVQENVSAFFAAEGDAASSDPLVEVVRLHPLAASRFIRIVMNVSIVGCAAVCVGCAIFLALCWSACEACDRPLRWWLLVHAMLQLPQIPIRCVFARWLRLAEREARTGSLEACVVSFTASPAWQMSKNLSLCTYAWLVLGVVWLMNSSRCPSCPSITEAMVAVILQAVLRAVAASAAFRILFPATDASPPEVKVEVASAEQIAALPLLRFMPGKLGESCTSCAVCLSDYAEGEVLRRMPCGHYFHRGCSDQWLQRSKRCPLCMQGIDMVKGSCCKAH